MRKADRLRVLVVEDSITMRRFLVDTLSADPAIEVIGEAEDGKRAIEMCRELKPDVMTLDMLLPVMTGMAVTEYVMAYCPTPILVVSSSTNRGELFNTYQALAAGAVDVLEKPQGDDADTTWSARLIGTVKIVARVKVITHLRGKIGHLGRTDGPRSESYPKNAETRLIAIGGSTGGPAAIVTILRALPAHFTIPIVLVIHIGQPFGAAFADWLDGQSEFRVRYARDGEPLPRIGQPGVVMASPDRHLMVHNGRFKVTTDAERHSCRPSVDILFESLAKEMGADVAACLLTGMGKDGAEGLLALRRAGAFTIAQDEASSVVFGMPKEAIQIGGAERILGLDQIAPTLAGIQRRTEAGRHS